MYSLIPAEKTACLPSLRLLTFDRVTGIHGEEDYMPPRILTIKAGINRCYLIKEEGAILIDAGPPGKIDTFKKAFEKFSINPHDIRLIILTHGDLDHTGSAEDLKQLTGAKIVIHRADQKLFEQALFNFPRGVTAWGKCMHAILSPLLKRILHGAPGARADIVLTDDDYPLTEYGIRGKIIDTPGHTPGSVSVLLETGDAFVGCMAHNSPPFRLGPGLPIFAEDIERVKQSWQPLLEQGATTIYPGHGEAFAADVIARALET